MPKKAKQPSFEKLKAKWYKKLEKDGFKDVEINEYEIKNPAYKYSHMRRDLKYTLPQAKIWWEAKQDYYYYANQFLNNYAFKSERDKLIWAYHAEGMSVRKIAKLLKKDKIWYTVVGWTIRKLAAIMKKEYLGIK